MPHEVTLRNPPSSFQCYGLNEAKQLGLVDSWGKPGTYDAISTVFSNGEGVLLTEFIKDKPDAILISADSDSTTKDKRYAITVYRPKARLVAIPPED